MDPSFYGRGLKAVKDAESRIFPKLSPPYRLVE
jgi:hypothetical protein